ncbi:MAG: adenosylcobalamin-dependent ribonucleoside-diphosphate reductase [Candidatus Pacearchaeota archaeon]
MARLTLTKNAKAVLNRFLARDKEGKIIETPEEMFKRIAKNISKEDIKYNQDSKKSEKEFLEAMLNLEFLPNIPVLANAGRKLQQLAACFVLPIPDSLDGIFQAVKDMAIIQKTGGGVGFSFSRLRPEGSIVGETGGIASGPVSFMQVFDCATGAIKEGGIRRGANMGILNVNHPDIEKFITCKDEGGFSNFNISVAITDKFMQAVEKNQKFNLEFNNKTYKTIPAKKLLDMLCKHAWLTGDPGILFIDTINRYNPTPKIGKIEATNPCGEQPLLPYESCVLGSINLEKVLENNRINHQKLERLIKLGVHFLDNCIDASSYPIPEIEKIVKGNRKIGLGIMGFANTLIRLGIPYDSEEAIRLAEEIMSFFQKKAYQASQELATIRGVFPNFEKSIWKGKMKMRNATCTTIAPTGTISIIADTSQSIEPIFAVAYRRFTHFGILTEVNPLFEEIVRKYNLSKKEVLKVIEMGSVQKTSLPEEIKRIFVNAHEISPEYHVKIQAAFQKYTDNAVSKTVNLPESASINEVKKTFLLAYKLGCKGLTIYRHKSKPLQVLTFCETCKIHRKVKNKSKN